MASLTLTVSLLKYPCIAQDKQISHRMRRFSVHPEIASSYTVLNLQGPVSIEIGTQFFF